MASNCVFGDTLRSHRDRCRNADKQRCRFLCERGRGGRLGRPLDYLAGVTSTWNLEALLPATIWNRDFISSSMAS
jgi:hypothetical protein